MPHPSQDPAPVPSGRALYLGIGPGGARSFKRTLRDRFNDHTRKNTGGSTARLVLASFLFGRAGWRPHWSDRPLLTKTDDDALSVCFSGPRSPRGRRSTNRDHNESHTFYL